MPGDTFIPAVRITSAFKRYSKNAVILNGLNMTVKQGTIYGLLGPSGCGKTTILSCIVGRTRLDSGEINLVYTERSQVGYMPQEVSLSNEFTINEAFNFYGTIFGMNQNQIDSRIKELNSLLELPPQNQKIKSCSGGQQRRISMAVTLFHNPQLLILDEPTVGVDPLLSNKIWEYFVKIVAKEMKTIIITTHYIEEAKNAHCIGLMRGGILLAENSPRKLMASENSDSLEETFLKLSMKHAKSEQQEAEQDKTIYPDGPKPEKTMQNNTIFNKSRFKAQFTKNCRATMRNLWVTLFVICVPPLSTFLLNLLFYEDTINYPIGVLNEEGFACHGPTDYVPHRDCLPKTPLSCIFTDLLRERTTVVELQTYNEGIKSIGSLKTKAMVHFKSNFSSYIMERLEEGGEASDEAGDWGNVFIIKGNNDNMVSSTIDIMMYQKLTQLLQEACRFCNYPLKLATIPVEIVGVVHGKAFDYIGQISAGYITAFLFYTNFMFTSSSLVEEKTSGCFERDRISGLTVLEILGAQFVQQQFLIVIQNITTLYILYGVFSNTMVGSMITLYIIVYFCQLLGIGYGILVALLVEKDILVAYAGIGTIVSITFLNGCLWAIEGMHWLIRPSGELIKATFGADAYFNVTLRGWGIFHWGVGDRIAVLLIENIGLSIISYALVKLKIISF